MVKIVTDSSAELTPQVAGELGVTVVPLYLHFGQEVYRDGLDMDADEFYRRLADSPVFPTTSAPGPGVFTEVYKGLVDQGHQVVSIHISGKLSATYQAALVASREMGDDKVAVVDSQNTSAGLGMLVVAAARDAAAGKSVKEVVSGLESVIPNTTTLFLLDTLEYLQKGGRIGRAQAFLGSLLNVKPILQLKDGEVHPLERARSRSRAINRLCELVAARAPVESLGVTHTTTPQEADEVAQRLAPLVPGKEIFRARIGPVLGAHCGHGVLGVAIIGAGGAGK